MRDNNPKYIHETIVTDIKDTEIWICLIAPIEEVFVL